MCDDEAFNLFALSNMLTDLKITSVFFESGYEAVTCFRKRLSAKCCSRTFRLVLTDISMPGMDGFDVATEINATQTYWYETMRK